MTDQSELERLRVEVVNLKGDLEEARTFRAKWRATRDEVRRLHTADAQARGGIRCLCDLCDEDPGAHGGAM